MKWIKVALAGCVSLLAMTAHAQADFVITPIAFALFAGPLGAIASFAGIYTGIQIAAYAAVLGAQLALSNRGQQKLDPGEWKNTFQEAETSEYNAIGRVKLGGLKAFGNTKANVISRLIWHVKGPMVAAEQYFLGGREVTVESNGQVSSPPWADPNGSWATIQSKPGNGAETAWPQLMTDFPSLWTAAHRCRGIFQSLIRFTIPDFSTEWGNKKFQKLYQGGAPDCEVIGRISPIYDPRQSGQDPDNPATWAWSDNGILAAVHVMRSYPDLKSADFDWPFLATEANRADAIVATISGTEPRARCWGLWPSESRRGDVMQQVLDSIGAEVVMSELGLIRIRLIDDAPSSEIAFTAKHIAELNWKSGPEAVERPNICRVKYYSPERGYDMGEINMSGIGWARIEDEIARYGEKYFDVELPFCPSPSQAQRIARRLFLQARADAGSIRTNMAGLAAWGVTYSQIEDADAEENMLCRLAAPRIDDEQGQVEIPYIVWPPALIEQPWNPATMEAPPPPPAPDIQYESELATPGAPTEAAVIQYQNGTYETRVKFPGVPGGTIAEANFRIYSGGEPNPFQSMTEYGGSSIWYGWAAANTAGGRVDFRSRFFNTDEEGSYFSNLLTINPMQIDNTPCAAPTLTPQPPQGDERARFTLSFGELRGTHVVVTPGPGGTGSQTLTLRPGVPTTLIFTGPNNSGSTDLTVNVTATVYTSNGTPGTPAHGSYVVPGNPP
ncbi:MAG TPA: phage tail protein [Rhizobiaceae bacterium]|nr:phage tail protein [Rhizobiaceae bacterium]